MVERSPEQNIPPVEEAEVTPLEKARRKIEEYHAEDTTHSSEEWKRLLAFHNSPAEVERRSRLSNFVRKSRKEK
jgi:hypothetical protein